jgi:hypothetical protein
VVHLPACARSEIFRFCSPESARLFARNPKLLRPRGWILHIRFFRCVL